MNRKWIGGLVAVALGAGALATVWAQQGRPFVFQGRSFTSQEAFIGAGLRCATPHVDDERAAQIDAHIIANRGGPGSNKNNNGKKPGDPPPPPPPVVTSGVIDVYAHVLTAANGSGGASPRQITDQITVLNSAFGNTGWQFRLVATDVTANDVLVHDGQRHHCRGASQGGAAARHGERFEPVLRQYRRRLARLGHVPVGLRRATAG